MRPRLTSAFGFHWLFAPLILLTSARFWLAAAQTPLPDGLNPRPDGCPFAFAVQADGRIIVGGQFNSLGGQPRTNLARFQADGTLDAGFHPAVTKPGPLEWVVWDFTGVGVASLAVQADGKILVGGSFTAVAGQPRTNVARLNPTDPPTQSISYDGSNMTWLRRGTSSEILHPTLEITTNGSDWALLGPGLRVPGGWRFPVASLPPEASLRARGQVAGGYFNGSGWYIESYYGRPLIAAPPVGCTNDAHTTATFNVSVLGYEPFSFRWLKAGVPLADGGNVVGAETAVLALTNVLGADAGLYSVLVNTSSGSVTSQVARLTVIDPLIAAGPAGQNREPGQTATFSVTPAGTAPFTLQWQKDSVALPGATGDSLLLPNLLGSDAGRYAVVVGNSFGSITSSPAPLTVNAVTVDSGFDAGAGNNTLYALAIQPDGKILAGGTFYNLGGQSRAHIARLNADGSADPGFNPGCDDMVLSLAVQEGRRILVGGYFTFLGGVTRNYLGRLNPDGTVDGDFDPSPNGRIFAVALQPDHSVLLGGTFSTVSGQPRSNLARLNPDGTLDPSFAAGADAIVTSLVVQTDGKILVGGYFRVLSGQPRTNLARLFPDGTLDANFNPGATSEDGYSSYISSLAVQADGKILVGGHFSTLGGEPRNQLARLNADGTVDAGFNPGARHDQVWTTPSVDSLAVQTDGKILVAGNFTTLAGQTRSYLGRLQGDGSLDLTFNPGVGSTIAPLFLKAVVVQPDGRILVGGSFTTVGGQSRTNLARLNSTEPASEALSHSGATITWRRGGSSPEVTRTTFEHTSDGFTWTSLGAGSRVSGGWQLTGVNPPAGGTVRARGWVAAAYQSASSWFVETLIGAPAFTTQLVSLTNNAGTTATFSLLAAGPGPLHFQWLKDGGPLADGPGVTGATTDTLILSNVLKATEGGYHLVLANASGSVTSQVATLTVVDPVITASPVSRYAEPGQSVVFSVTAAGTSLNYQWWKDGAALSGANGTSLTLANVQLGDAGGYSVVVSNAFGSVTSAVATLTVNLATLDANFHLAVAGIVSPLALQADGKILLGGTFNTLEGYSRSRLGRLNADGSLDTRFNSQANATVYAFAVQPDGKILVGGDFTSLGGAPRPAIGRLNTNGIVDPGFTTTIFNPPPGSTITARVQAILPQPDGKIVIAGRSSRNNGPVGGFVSRLNTNGSTDTTFITTGGVNGPVSTLAPQADGKILVGGLFTSLRNEPRLRIGRLHSDGTLDRDFSPGADGGVFALTVEANGDILMGGAFKVVAGQPRTNFARVHPDATLDTGFAPAVTGGSMTEVLSVAVQTDGKILISGFFSGVAGQPRANVARLLPNGTLDANFNPVANGGVYGLALEADGQILAAGEFTQLGGQPRSRIARLNPTEAAGQELTFDGSTVRWRRAGASPEVGRVTFEFAEAAASWSQLGNGTRTALGWELGGLIGLPDGRIRARGYTGGGGYNTSSWFVESILGAGPIEPPRILASTAGFDLASGRFGFEVSGQVGQVVVIEGSLDLKNWSPRATNTLGAGPFSFRDPGSVGLPLRFYRAQSPGR